MFRAILMVKNLGIGKDTITFNSNHFDLERRVHWLLSLTAA